MAHCPILKIDYSAEEIEASLGEHIEFNTDQRAGDHCAFCWHGFCWLS